MRKRLGFWTQAITASSRMDQAKLARHAADKEQMAAGKVVQTLGE
jgi:hypothetical protein